MSSNQQQVSYTVSAGTTSITTAAGVVGFTAVPGQIGLILRCLGGGSLEIGGASLASGTGYLLSSGANVPATYVRCSGTIYLVATSATSTFSFLREISAGNPGSLG